jgi:hypothetical protein
LQPFSARSLLRFYYLNLLLSMLLLIDALRFIKLLIALSMSLVRTLERLTLRGEVLVSLRLLLLL